MPIKRQKRWCQVRVVSYKHLEKMTDDTGIIQFAKYDNPIKESGYTVDDNARALIVALNKGEEDLAKIYIEFIKSAQRPDGTFANLKLDEIFVSDIDSEDSIGRAFMSCCYALCSENSSLEIKEIAKEIVEKTLPIIGNFKSLRAIAYSLIGLASLLGNRFEGAQNIDDICKIADDMANRLNNAYTGNRSKNWQWFEEYLTYCNAVLPHSLFLYYAVSGDLRSLKIAEESLNFLTDSLFKNGYLSIVGNHGWWQKDGEIPPFDQQPVDAASITLACICAYFVKGKKDYLDMAKLSYRWYWGKNINSLQVYNENSGGCHDALTSCGINMNQGAESLVSFLLTHQILENILNSNAKNTAEIPAV